MTETGRARPGAEDTQQARERLLGIIRELALEMHPGRGRQPRITPHSRLDRDLGFDSLSRVELLLRVNRTFGVELSESALTDAETPEDLLQAIGDSRPASLSVDFRESIQPLSDAGDLPDHARTLMDVLDWHAEAHPQRTHVLLYEDSPEPVVITYADLHGNARRAAAGLQALGVRPGDNVALMLPTGRDYLAAFYGALYAG
jgi:acyl carrier protein